MSRPCFVERLKGSAPQLAVINPGRGSQDTRASRAINTPAPCQVSDGIVFLWPFLLQKGFCLAVSRLLSPIGPQRIPAAVPHLCGGAEAQLPSALLQTPAHVDVVASDPELHVEAAHGFQRGSQKRQVEAGRGTSLVLAR